MLNDLKQTINQIGGSNNIYAISSLDLETLDGGDEEKVDGVISAIATTPYYVVAPGETGVWVFGSMNSRQKLIGG